MKPYNIKKISEDNKSITVKICFEKGYRKWQWATIVIQKSQIKNLTTKGIKNE